MPAYVIGEVEITDSQAYQEYAKRVPETIAQHGGRYLARGGTVETKEGDWNPKRVVVLEFPTMDQARKWYHSPEYGPVLAIRLKCAKAKLILVEGVS
jgi:uncharacterized protein (DUF1330 family)